MPKLPDVFRSNGRIALNDPDVALSVALFLYRRGGAEGKNAYRFAAVVRKWMDANPTFRGAFIEWFERQ